MDMDHDIKSLQASMEARFDAVDARSERQHAENRTTMALLDARTAETNGRLRKLEVVVAVLKFAVFTIGGALVYAGLQIVVSKLSGRLP